MFIVALITYDYFYYNELVDWRILTHINNHTIYGWPHGPRSSMDWLI